MHPTIALMVARTIEDDRRRQHGQHRAPREERAEPSRSSRPMSLIEMFRASHRGLAIASR